MSSDTRFSLAARPEALRLSPQETAVIVIDMQNAYASPGGYVDLAGFDISGAAAAITRIGEVLEAARAAGIQIVYLQNGWDSDYIEAGTPNSPNFHKSNALKMMRARPELQGRLLARGTWDYEIVDALTPRPGDIRVAKTRYSAFFNSQLDSILRARGIRNLVFVGIATNVCVESTLRDGFHLEYFGVMLEDATHQLGPDFIQQAAVYNIETFFGWVSTAADFRAAIGQLPQNHPEGYGQMPMTTINPPGFAPPIAPYSSGTTADGVVYVSGTLAFDSDGTIAHVGDAAGQTRHVLETIRKVLEAAGGTMADITFNHVFLTDWSNYAAINAVYAEYFPDAKPARYCIQCGLVRPELLVEIASTAHVGQR